MGGYVGANVYPVLWPDEPAPLPPLTRGLALLGVSHIAMAVAGVPLAEPNAQDIITAGMAALRTSKGRMVTLDPVL